MNCMGSMPDKAYVSAIHHGRAGQYDISNKNLLHQRK